MFLTPFCSRKIIPKSIAQIDPCPCRAERTDRKPDRDSPNETLKQLLTRLEHDDATPLTTFRRLIEVGLALACLQRTLGLSLKDD